MKINYFNYGDITLGDKYEKTFEKFEEKADITVNALKESQTNLDSEKETLNQLLSEVRDIRLQYVGAKRKALFGEDVSKQAGELDFLFEGVDILTKDAAKSDRKMAHFSLKTKRMKPSKILDRYKNTSESERNQTLVEKDDVQDILDDLYNQAKFRLKSIDRKKTSNATKLEKKEFASAKEKWTFKSKLSELEMFQEQAENIINSFYRSFDIKV